MRIERVLFQIEGNRVLGPQVHIELNQILPAYYQVGDLVEGLEPTETGTDFEVTGIRSPASKFVTLRPIPINYFTRGIRTSAQGRRRSTPGKWEPCLKVFMALQSQRRE